MLATTDVLNRTRFHSHQESGFDRVRLGRQDASVGILRVAEMVKDALSATFRCTGHPVTGQDTLACGDQVRTILTTLDIEWIVWLERAGEGNPGVVEEQFCSVREHLLEIEHFSGMRRAAETQDPTEFVRHSRSIEWSRQSPADFERSVRWALAAGAHLEARALSQNAAELFPNEHEIKKMARILAYPKIIDTHVPPNPTLKANRAWLHENRDQFRGQWVALRAGKLLASGRSAATIKERVGDLRGLFVTKVT